MSDEGRKMDPQAERAPDSAVSGNPEHSMKEASALGDQGQAKADADVFGSAEQVMEEADALDVRADAEVLGDAEQAKAEANVLSSVERAIAEADALGDREQAKAEADVIGSAEQAMEEAVGFGAPGHEALGPEWAEALPALEASPGGVTAEEADTALDEVDLNWGIADICRSKAQEFRMLGYEHVTGEEIWECVSDKYHKTGTPPLHRIVNDILSLKVTQFMNWMTMSIYKEGRF